VVASPAPRRPGSGGSRPDRGRCELGR